MLADPDRPDKANCMSNEDTVAQCFLDCVASVRNLLGCWFSPSLLWCTCGPTVG